MSGVDDVERIRATSESDARFFERCEVLMRAFGVATFITVPVATWALATGTTAVPEIQVLLIAAIAPLGLLVSAWLHRRMARKHGLLALLVAIGALSAAPSPAQVGGKVTRIVEQRPYDPIKDFAAVANIGMQSYVLMTNADLPAHRARELMAARSAVPEAARGWVFSGTAKALY